MITNLGIAIAATVIATGITMTAMAGIGAGIAYAVSKTVESIAKQPEAESSILRTFFVGVAVAETTGIFAFIIAIILLFANPLIKLL